MRKFLLALSLIVLLVPFSAHAAFDLYLKDSLNERSIGEIEAILEKAPAGKPLAESKLGGTIPPVSGNVALNGTASPPLQKKYY